MLSRQKFAIIIEGCIACLLFGFGITYIVLVIFEVPFSVSFGTQQLLPSLVHWRLLAS